MPGFNFVNTSQSATRDAKTGLMTQPGISCYKNASDVDNDSTTYEKTELIIECGTTEVDPFDDNPEEDKTNRFPFEPQYRARAIVSEKFNCHKNGNILLDFLWRFSQSDGASRGFDGTVTRAPPTEAKMARTALSKWAPANKHSVFKVQVPDPDPDGDKKRTRPFFVWAPLEDARTVTGRATRGYPAWDPKGDDGKGRVVFLKDSWRSCEPGMEKEVDILKELKDKKCRNVPELVCGDDLHDQTTVTHKYADELWNIGAEAHRVVQRIHTRFVEKNVGSHLTSATQIENGMNSRKFLKIVFDAFIAHYDAYVLCGILHRDISSGNILVDEDGNGFLNDWDLSKHITNHVARQGSRAARNVAIHVVRPFAESHETYCNTLQDDLESCFWIITYHILRYMTHNQPEHLKENMYAIFESYIPAPLGEEPQGGNSKATIIDRGHPLKRNFEVIGNEPLTTFFRQTLYHLKKWHRLKNSHADEVAEYAFTNKVSPEVADAHLPLNTDGIAMCSHQAMMNSFNEALAEGNPWPTPEADFFVDNLSESNRHS